MSENTTISLVDSALWHAVVSSRVGLGDLVVRAADLPAAEEIARLAALEQLQAVAEINGHSVDEASLDLSVIVSEVHDREEGVLMGSFHMTIA